MGSTFAFLENIASPQLLSSQPVGVGGAEALGRGRRCLAAQPDSGGHSHLTGDCEAGWLLLPLGLPSSLQSH